MTCKERNHKAPKAIRFQGFSVFIDDNYCTTIFLLNSSSPLSTLTMSSCLA